MKTRHYFAALETLEEGRFVVRELGKHSVGAVLLKGDPLVILNYCPHAGAPLCKGNIVPKLVSNPDQSLDLDPTQPVVRCPWHGWEFSLNNGSTSNFQSRYRLAKLQYEVENGTIFVWL